MTDSMILSRRAVWHRAILWVGGLAPFFFLTYNLANWVASQRTDVGSLVFSWERHIPLLPWTILPYWSVDLLYGCSFLLFRRAQDMNRHGLRLLTVQIICVTCFLLCPLHFSFERPPMTGVFKTLFDLLMGFDKPYNQAPSLHIAIVMVLWPVYASNTSGMMRWLVHVWFGLIGVSVLTTWQHHFIDIPTGMAVGCFAVWLWPWQRRTPWQLQHGPTVHPRRRIMAGYYFSGGGVFAGLAMYFGGGVLWLWWGTLSLWLVAVNYWWIGAEGFQKHPNGTMSWLTRLLYGPYLVGAWWNVRYWTRHHAPANEIVGGIWLGRLPGGHDARQYASVVDLCAELPVSLLATGTLYRLIPVLDLTAPDVDACLSAVQTIEEWRKHGPLLICCALGYSRSATVLAAWLLYSSRCQTVDDAILLIQQFRPQVVFHAEQRATLQQFITVSRNES